MHFKVNNTSLFYWRKISRDNPNLSAQVYVVWKYLLFLFPLHFPSGILSGVLVHYIGKLETCSVNKTYQLIRGILFPRHLLLHEFLSIDSFLLHTECLALELCVRERGGRERDPSMVCGDATVPH